MERPSACSREIYVTVSKSAGEIKNGIKALINSAENRKRKIIKRKQNKDNSKDIQILSLITINNCEIKFTS